LAGMELKLKMATRKEIRMRRTIGCPVERFIGVLGEAWMTILSE
jgi:hypothetical protein